MQHLSTRPRIFVIRITAAASLLAICISRLQAAETPELATVVVRDKALRAYVVETTSAGTRSETPVEHIPQSVVSLPRALIEDQASKTLADTLRNVSNVAAQDQRDANNVGFRIRGFTSATVVDGVTMPGYFANNESLLNVDQIDVIKGPSGGLFGASQSTGSYGATGGTVAITTASPVNALIRQLGLRLGAQNEKGANFDLNQPLSNGLAARLAGEWSDSDSESNRVFFKRRALFPSLAWAPNASSKLVIKARYLENETLDYSGLPTSGTLDTSAFTLAKNTNLSAIGLPPTTNNAQGINVQWTQKFSDVWSFGLRAAYNQAEVDQRGTWLVNTLAPNGCFEFGNVTANFNTMCGARLWDKFETVTISPSWTAKFNAGSLEHQVQLGVDYEQTHDKAFMAYSNVFGPVSFDNVDLTTTTLPAWAEPVAPATPDQQNRYTATVLYAQDQMQVGAWHFLASLRHSNIEIVDSNPAFGISNRSKNTKTTPRVGVVYEFTPQVSAFTGYGEGIKVPTGSNFLSPPKPETSKQVELGLRLKNLFGITATLAWFDLTRENVAMSDPSNPGKSIQAGQQQSKGIDLDARWQITDAWSLLAALTSQSATITKDSNAAIVGKQLFNVPEQSARLATRYEFKSGPWAGMGLGLGVSQHAKLPGNSTNTFFTPAGSLWDAQVSYQLEKVRLGLSVTNLTDKHYYIPANYFGGNQVMPVASRAALLTANFSF
jgi:iron complex outermembrane recepter protein